MYSNGKDINLRYYLIYKMYRIFVNKKFYERNNQ
jgi:hypothetical protein